MVSVRTSIVPPGPCPPLEDTPGASPAATAPQVTASIHDFAVSLAGDLAFALENIFDGNGIQHEIGLYYHVAWPATLAPDDLRRGTRSDRFRWMAVRTLSSIQFEPAGLIHSLQNGPGTLEHVILGRPEP